MMERTATTGHRSLAEWARAPARRSVSGTTVVLVIGLWAWASCTSEDDTAPPPSGGLCEELARIACAQSLACGCFGGTAMDVCLGLLVGDCDLHEQVDKGYQAWDTAAVDACLAAAREFYTDCDPGGSLECGELTYGLVEAGGYCDGNGDCVTGLLCVEGVCSEPIPAGQPCPSGTGCETDAYCGDDDVCRQRGSQGEACPEPDKTWTCASGLLCDPATSTCQPPPPPLGEGESCEPNTGQCASGLYCPPSTSTCEPRPAEGEPCEHSGTHGGCAEGLYCAEEGTCLPLLHAGEPCTEDASCPSGNCRSGVCRSSLCFTVG